MPELPEVETSRRGLLPYIQNSVITKVVVNNSNLRWKLADDFVVTIVHKTVITVSRRGKYLIFHLAQADEPAGYILCHLGMSGSLRLEKSSSVIKKHDHLVISFQNKASNEVWHLHYHDPRRFGFWLLADNLATNVRLAKLGLEPLSDEFNENYLLAKVATRKQAIKVVLMDPSIVVGVGNIYVSEALFLVGINPLVAANSLPKKVLKILCKRIKLVLQQSIDQGGTTLRDFVNPNGNIGYFQVALNVYGREGEKCNKCEASVKKIIIAQRSTFYCPTCQK